MNDLFPGTAREYRFTIEDLIAEMRRELEMRRRVYPGSVKAGKMSRALAVRQSALAAGILRVLENHKPGEVYIVPVDFAEGVADGSADGAAGR